MAYFVYLIGNYKKSKFTTYVGYTNNLKNRIKEIEHTEEYQKNLKKTSHNECYECCGGIVTPEIEKEWKEREKKEHWSEHRRKSFELSTALYFYYRKKAEVEEANKPWWRFW